MLSLGTDYDLSSPGTYTVVVVREVDFIAVLLAKPLRLKVEKGPTVTEAAGAAPPVSGPVEPGDREWSELAARAGQPAGSFRLEVVPPSVHAGGLYLVASLICIDPKAGAGGDNRHSAKTGRDPAGYTVLVRDAMGGPVPRLARAKPATRIEPPEGSHRRLDGLRRRRWRDYSGHGLV